MALNKNSLVYVRGWDKDEPRGYRGHASAFHVDHACQYLKAAQVRLRQDASVERKLPLGKAISKGWKPCGKCVLGPDKQFAEEFAMAAALKMTNDREELVERANQIIAQGHVSLPKGNKTPKHVASSKRGGFLRDPEVVAWVLQEAKGVCDYCEKSGPFKNKNGIHYLEVHHIKPLASLGGDTPDNACAVCPNCHRLLHCATTSLRKTATARVTKVAKARVKAAKAKVA